MRTETTALIERDTGIAECLDRLAAEKRRHRPLATYRLQFNRHFTFEDARRLVPYLEALGVSHCYASPTLKAREGSQHGYDITDHNALNPEIGTDAEFAALVAELKQRGMGLVLDVVPNHMGVGHGTNPWWQDVLENGEASPYADFFDIDWDPLKVELRHKLLLPILGAQYGEELESGHITLRFEEGRLFLLYYDKSLPLDPQTVPLLFEEVQPVRARMAEKDSPHAREFAEFRALLGEMRDLPPHTASLPEEVEARQERAPGLLHRFARLAERSPVVRTAVEEAVALTNGAPGEAHSFDVLHRLLEAQVYRLAHWRVSAEEINYRRFFDINDLVGLRMENPRVFAETHRLIRRLLADGSVAGLRIDHPDGLLNPRQYVTRLQMLFAASQCCGGHAQPPLAENGIEEAVQRAFGEHDWVHQKPPLYVVLEKIVERGEELPPDWPVEGTVGYDFANLVNGLFIDARRRKAFTTLYHRFTGMDADVERLIYESKMQIMRNALAGEVNVLTHMLEGISSRDRRARDFTRSALRDAIRESIACFPVYRTYIDERGSVSERDRAYIGQAVARAKRRNADMPAAVFDFLREVLLLEPRPYDRAPGAHRKRLLFTLKFQQLTGPVMAKGLEDTACYVYNRFISVNEVGGSPAEFGVAVDEFHRANEERQERWPGSMLATSTHDTKRSEDVRARLNVLSEMPKAWSAEVMRWRRLNRLRKRVLPDGRAVPDHNEEYLLYQTLVGTWPFDLRQPQAQAQYLDRIQSYMTKAVHEAKVNLSWINQNPAYVEALQHFLAQVLRPGKGRRPNHFFDGIERFLPPVMFFGAINSLAQTLLKITSPGVPDLYQGTELWDFSLVDPDNRRPVDFAARERAAADLRERGGGDPLAVCDELLRNWKDGRVKLWTSMRALRARQARAELFQSGSYFPLMGSGPKQEHLVAFARVHRDRTAVVAVPRLSYTLMNGAIAPPLGDAWEATEIQLPSRVAELENAITGEVLRPVARSLSCREVFARFPVALLVSR